MDKKLLLVAIFSCGALFSADVVEHLRYSTIGTICPQYRSVLGSQVAGNVMEICHEVGDSVRQGDVLLRLDPTLFSLAVSESISSLCLQRVLNVMTQKRFCVKSIEMREGEIRYAFRNRQRKEGRIQAQENISLANAIAHFMANFHNIPRDLAPKNTSVLRTNRPNRRISQVFDYISREQGPARKNRNKK